MSSSPTDAGVVDVVMPQLGVSVAEGTLLEWRKRVGEWVEYEEPICDISTDKIDTELPAPAAGRLDAILVEAGTTVDVGTVLARLATGPTAAEHEPVAGNGDAASAAAPPARRRAAGEPRRYSPVVQRIATEHGLDLERIAGSGRDGRVRKQDVLAALAKPPTPEPPLHIESPYRADLDADASAAVAYVAPAAQPLSRVRRAIGEHMKRSLETAATCTTWIDVDMSAVERERARLGTTALPIVAHAAIEALGEHPELNAWIEGDEVTLHREVNLGIAVSLGADGLIVPVIHSAQQLAPREIGAEVKRLAGAARARTLRPDDVHGATFTITNPGQYGSIMATPVINQPQVAILDLEAIVKRPVVVTDGGDDAIAIRPTTVLGLSWDHRALDGAQAAQFLASVRRRLERL